MTSWPDAEVYLSGGDKTASLNGEAHLKARLWSSPTPVMLLWKQGIAECLKHYYAVFDTKPVACGQF